MSRPSWDETWMHVAQAISTRSICVGRAIGAVIVDTSNRIVSTGYNGPPRGFDVDGAKNCREFCPRSRKSQEEKISTVAHSDCYTVHAEANALLFSDRRSYEGGTLYVTSLPCWECAKMIANSGVRRVVFILDRDLDAHRDPDRVIRFIDQCGLDFSFYHPETKPADEWKEKVFK